MRPEPFRWLVLSLLFALLPGPGVSAQTIEVRSGEHVGFTRLVLDIGVERTWTLADEGSMRRLDLDPPVEGFAIGQVFDLIPRTRLSALDANRSLTLTLGCDCDVTATRHDGRYLVLDIAEAPADPRPAPSPPRPADPRTEPVSPLPDLATVMVQERPERLPLRPEPPAAPSVDMAEAARIMSEQLARAAASGLLEAAPGRPLSDADPSSRAVQQPTGTAPPPEPVPPVPPVLEPGVPLRAATAFDLAALPQQPPMPLRNDLACSGAALSVRDWSTGLGVHHGLGALRLAVLDERDRLQPEAVLALARHYLFHGFGAEAADWLRQLESPPGDLLVIAALVDGAEGARFPVEADPVACSDEELLWRYLDDALGEQPPDARHVASIQRGAAALPPVLRDQVVPRIALRLRDDGFPDAARNLRDMLQRGGRLSALEILALDRDLGLATPETSGMASALETGLRDDAADPVGRMAQALAFGRETGALADTARLDAADALLRENGVGPDTAALWSETILARARLGQIDRVLGLLTQGGSVSPEQREAVLTALVEDRVSAADTGALFVLARLHGPAWRSRGSDAGRARVAAIALLREAGLEGAADMMRAGQPPLILPARAVAQPETTDRVRVAWQIGDWSDVALQGTGVHADIATRMVRPLPELDRSGEPLDLSALAARVADSRTLRQEITSLLETPSPAVQP